MTADTETIKFRNPVKALGFAMCPHIVTLDQELAPGAYRLYNLYLYYAHQKGQCWPGRPTLATQFGVSVSTISRWTVELVSLGYVTRERRRDSSSMTWIENVEQIPRLVALAKTILQARIAKAACRTSDTSKRHVAPVTHPTSQECDVPMSQECDVEEESDQEESEKDIGGGSLSDVDLAETTPPREGEEPPDEEDPLDLSAVWESGLKELRMQTTAGSYSQNFQGSKLVGFDLAACSATLAVQNDYVAEWVSTRLDRQVAFILGPLCGLEWKALRIDCRVLTPEERKRPSIRRPAHHG